MHVRNYFGVFWFLVSLPALAGSIHVDDGVDYSVPTRSPVKFVSLDKTNLASFKGRFTISGTYHYGYYSDHPTAADASAGVIAFDLYFIPDLPARNRLPYWHQAGHVKQISFTNKAEFVATVIPASARKQLRARKVLSVNGRASILVDSYQASIECNWPDYSVRFVSVQGSPTMQLAMLPIEEFGC